MIWGYSGIFTGGFRIWDGDQTMNKLQFMVDHGFRSTGLSFSEVKQDPARRDQIAQFVAEHDLLITPHPRVPWLKGDDETIRRASDAFLADLQAYGDLLRVPICPFGVGPFHRFMKSPTLEEQMDRLAEVLAPVAKACHEMGRPLGIENHGDYYCSDLVELCKRVPGLGIFLDTGNTYLIGERSVPACIEAAPYTIGTHFKDHYVHPQPKGLLFVIKGAPLGEGHVGLREIYQALIEKAPNPKGLILQWEMIPPKDMDPFECLERSWAFVRSLPEAP